MRKPGKSHHLPKRTPGAESSRKVLSLLAYFDLSRTSASMETLAGAIKAPRSTAYRYVSLLREFGFLMELQAGQYALGPRALGMARAAQAAISYADIAHPLMEGLSHDTGETVFLLRRVGDHAICIGRCDPVSPVRIFLEIGSAVPLHIGASPKMLLAHLPAREREVYLARAAKGDAALRRGLGKLREELDRMREHGTAITIDEITPDVWACAAPIFENDKVIAAVSVAGPIFRIDKARRSTFEAMVKAAAAGVSAQIGEKQWPTQARLTA
jgi:DNA-binding IclR family transcriptional regulator